jgi:hypothetical protein
MVLVLWLIGVLIRLMLDRILLPGYRIMFVRRCVEAELLL